MTPSLRLVALAVIFIVGFHSILSLTHEEYGRATSLASIASRFRTPAAVNLADAAESDRIAPPGPDGRFAHTRKANATLLMLARNDELEGVLASVRRLEDRFNRKHKYPWVFLNEVPFTQDFISRVSVLTDAEVSFGLIEHEHWFQPDWIDEERATEGRDELVALNIIHSESVPYRNMCRFNSGFFYKHELLQKYRWYWRVEPGVDYYCDIESDPFLFMGDNNKTYGFTISMYEYEPTIRSLWGTVKDFVAEHPQYLARDNALGFISDDGGDTYNMCHFWSNFEIADMDFWRSAAYEAFFAHLDATGGFYYERWGDAPVHSIAAALFLPRSALHFFNDIGYEHPPYGHCPQGTDAWKRGKCVCDPAQSFEYDQISCLRPWDAAAWA